MSRRPWAGIAALVAVLGTGALVGETGVLLSENAATSAQAQRNEANAISALRHKDGQIDALRAELEQVLAATTPADRAAVVSHFASPVVTPTVGRQVTRTQSSPAPRPTTATTTRAPAPPAPAPAPALPHPAPCTTVPVLGGCLP